MSERKTIAIDFDGTVHSYTSGWKGALEIPDPPVPGAFEFIEAVLEHFDVCIFSTRAEIYEAASVMRDWFVLHGMSYETVMKLHITNRKPKALVYIDDRGFRFEGTWPTVEELKVMKPWNKR